MPWHWQANTLHLKIAIWRIEEPESYFLQRCSFVDAKALARYQHPQSRLHWLASRLLLHEVLGPQAYQALEKDAYGKPISRTQKLELSISHSENLVAIALATAPQKIGLDIQQFSPKLERIAAKFIPSELLQEIQEDSKFKEIVHVHWGIKEALFKAYGKGKLDFKKHLKLHWNQQFSVKDTSFSASIQKEDILEYYQACYQLISENYLLCAVTKSENHIIKETKYKKHEIS